MHLDSPVNDPPMRSRPRKRDYAGLIGYLTLSLTLAVLLTCAVIGHTR